tara:strand:- start:1305 stop:1781 length:477 start_codon:yes stop_codon:yes gene_type:complete
MTKPSINLNQMLTAIDVGNVDFYKNLDSELKKTFSPYISMRFTSNIKSNKILQETHIENVNEFCNKHFSTIQKHGDDSLLFWKLLCLSGSGKKQFHPWLKAPKGKRKKTKVLEFLQNCFPNYKNDELELLNEILDKKELKQLARDAGLDDNEVKKLVK